jgi:vacuolar-type H+-ATPase subunit E/Vma4
MLKEKGAVPLRDEERHDLEHFKQAIRQDHMLQLEKLKTEIDEHLADVVIAKRMKVEREVETIRTDHTNRYRFMLYRQELHAKQQLRRCLMDLHSEMISQLEDRFRNGIESLRKDREKYKRVLQSLIDEGYAVFQSPFILKLTKEDSGLFSSSDIPVVEIREMDEDLLGGCILEFPDPVNAIFDNSFRTRWFRLLPELSERLTHEIDQCLGPTVQEFSRKLRIS